MMGINDVSGNGNDMENVNSCNFDINKNNRRIIDWKQFNIWRDEKLKNSNDITHEEVNRYLNRYFWEYSKRNGYKKTSLMENNFFEPIIPQDIGKVAGIRRLFVQNVIGSYTNIVPVIKPYGDLVEKNGILLPDEKDEKENADEYESRMRDLLSISKESSVVCVETHATFAGIPISACELQKYAKRFDMPQPKIYVCLSGALSVQSNRNVIQSISNLVQTLANTDNSKDIKLPRWALLEIRKTFKDKIFELTSEPGNIVLVAPTAKRDIVIRGLDGTANSICFGNDDVPNVSSFLGILRELADKNVSVALMGINETNMKDPLVINEEKRNRIFLKDYNKGSGVYNTEIFINRIRNVLNKNGRDRNRGNDNEKNNDWSVGNTYISMQILEPEETKHLIETKTFMSILASHVKDRNGKQIGYAIEFEKLRKLDAELKIKNKQQVFCSDLEQKTGCSIDFSDTVYQKTIRAIFEVLKDYDKWTIRRQMFKKYKDKKLNN